jgi:tellurite resistance protein
MKLDTRTIERLRDALMEQGQRTTMVLSPAYESLTREGLLTDAESELLVRIDPIAEAMFLMMTADGEAAQEELDVIRGAIRDLSDSKLRSGTIEVMMETYGEKVGRDGWKVRLQRVAEHLSSETSDAEMAYTLVAAVALADAEVTLEENELIDRFAELLGLTDARCCDLLDEVRHETRAPWTAED